VPVLAEGRNPTRVIVSVAGALKTNSAWSVDWLSWNVVALTLVVVGHGSPIPLRRKSDIRPP
jgi:hypothetical protein